MIEVFNHEQGSPEWYACRLGIPTASEFHTVLAEGKDGGASKTRRMYMMKLLGERITGEPMDNYSNGNMERGKEMEEEARNMYVFLSDSEPERVGFVRNGNSGCSPDSLIGDAGLLEIKTKFAHIQAEVLLADVLPPAHRAQIQGQLWICEREWVDFVSYWPKMPLFAKRVYRDEVYIKRLAGEVQRFWTELLELEERMRAGTAARGMGTVTHA